MKTVKEASDDVLIEKSFEDLHNDNYEWSSDIEMWKEELNFFQKLLEYHIRHVQSVDDKKEIDHYQNLIIYYKGELLDEFTKTVRVHDKTLIRQLESDNINAEEYLNKHRSIYQELSSFRNEYHKYKRDIFNFMTRMMNGH